MQVLVKYNYHTFSHVASIYLYQNYPVTVLEKNFLNL